MACRQIKQNPEPYEVHDQDTNTLHSQAQHEYELIILHSASDVPTKLFVPNPNASMPI